MKKAKKQGNTYPDLVERKQRKEVEGLKAQFGDKMFVPRDKGDK
jgi:hypothetical protein